MPKKFTISLPADFSYEWTVQPDGRPTLVFNQAMWAVFEQKAASRNKTAHQLINEIIVRSLIDLCRDS